MAFYALESRNVLSPFSPSEELRHRSSLSPTKIHTVVHLIGYPFQGLLDPLGLVFGLCKENSRRLESSLGAATSHKGYK